MAVLGLAITAAPALPLRAGGTLIEGDRARPRCVLVRMSAEFIEQLVIKVPDGQWSDHVRVQRGLPPGARLVGAQYNALRGHLELVFEHESFPPVAEGADPDCRLPLYETFRCAGTRKVP